MNNNIADMLFGNEYYTLDDLRYNKKLGFLFSKEEMSKFLIEKSTLIKEKNKYIKCVPLKSFNSEFIYYVFGGYLVSNYSEYLSTIIEDYNENKNFIFTRNIDDIMKSRLFSEIEGTLNIENVPTTHKRIKEIYESDKVTEKNDIIIKNMQNAINYIINEKPKFNKDNLLRLYKLLSNDCLKSGDELQEGAYYRNDNVTIGGFEGVKYENIDAMMDSLFHFVNDPKSIVEHKLLLPHICHYYMLYVHPYFDYNGRTARMVSFWLNEIFEIVEAPLFMSEAINEYKQEYYRAIINTRNTDNDLTYFLGFILESSIKFSLIYKNIESIKNMLAKNGEFLTPSELVYLKKIIIHNSEDYFNCKMFFEYINNTMSKQAGLKILNHLNEYGILEKRKNKRNEVIYRVSQDFITYKFKK